MVLFNLSFPPAELSNRNTGNTIKCWRNLPHLKVHRFEKQIDASWIIENLSQTCFIWSTKLLWCCLIQIFRPKLLKRNTVRNIPRTYETFIFAWVRLLRHTIFARIFYKIETFLLQPSKRKIKNSESSDQDTWQRMESMSNRSNFLEVQLIWIFLFGAIVALLEFLLIRLCWQRLTHQLWQSGQLNIRSPTKLTSLALALQL